MRKGILTLAVLAMAMGANAQKWGEDEPAV